MPERWARALSIVAVAAAVVSGGCGDDDDASSATSTSATTTTTAAPTSTSAPPRTSTTSTSAPATTVVPKGSTPPGPGTPSTPATTVAPPPEAGLASFTTPSGNIGCVMDEGFVRCDIGDADWTLPPRPADCELDWGHGVVLGDEVDVGICAGDTAMGGPDVVAYGTSVTRGDLRCESERTGLTCRNRSTGAGFRLSRAAVELL